MLLFGLTAVAKPVDQAAARQVATNFWNAHRDKGVAAVNSPMTLIGSEFDAFYIFANGTQGFVIVAADDCVQPVLAYSFSNPASENINPEVRYWLSTYQQQIDWMRNNGIVNPDAAKSWQLYGAATQGDPMPLTAVAPMLTTSWDQSPYYNNLCPYDNVEHERTVTGCVATAMAQVMKYWNHPSQGTGSHSYVEDDYGTLSVNFGATTYQWSQMPNSLTGSSSTAQVNAVATLMYHCGVAIEMNYGVEASGAQMTNYGYSYSQIPSTQDALHLFFGYTDSIEALYRDDNSMTDAVWKNYIKNEIDASRPVLYSGFDSTGGHCFVCDGYNTAETQFHFNWGWSGYYNGYYSLNDLSLGGGGTGTTATYSFNLSQQILINVHPAGNSGGVVEPDPMCLISSFPYTENFDDTSTYGCLRLLNVNGDNVTWGIIDSFGTNYSHAAFIQYAVQADDYLILPGIVTPGNYSLSWKARAYQSNYPETYQVLAGDSLIFSETLSATALTTRNATFSVAAGDTVNVMFRYISDDMYAFFLDDITIDTVAVTPPDPPTPPTPEDVCLITSFPYTENFDDTSTYSCLQLLNANGDNITWGIIDSFGTNYSHAAFIQYAVQADDYLILPGIVTPGNYNLSWKARAYQSNYPESYQVLAGDNLIFSETLSATTLTTRNATFTVTAGDTVNVMFRYISDDMYAFFLDDITIDTAAVTPPDPPTPPTPEDVCLITSFPYTENFDDTSTYSCLHFYNANGDNITWGIIDSFGTAYSHAAFIQYAVQADDYLILPGIVTPGNYSLSWKARAYQSNYPETYQVLAGDSLIFSETLSATALTTRNATFSVAAGDTVNVMFRYISDDMYAFFLDDITITTSTPNPPSPTQYTLTVVSNNDAWGTVSGGGTYNQGATVTISATANSGYHFVQWNDGSTQNPRTVTVTANATYVATFEANGPNPPTQYTLTVLSNNDAYGTVSGGGTYNEGAVVTISAVANNGYHFVRWNDGSTQNPRTVTVTANATYVATFEANVGIDDASLAQVNLYPNPATDKVTLSGLAQQARIDLIDATGRTLATWTSVGEHTTLDISRLSRGNYFLRITDATGIIVRKMTVK